MSPTVQVTILFAESVSEYQINNRNDNKRNENKYENQSVFAIRSQNRL